MPRVWRLCSKVMLELILDTETRIYCDLSVFNETDGFFFFILQRTSVLCVLGRRVLVTRAPAFTESSLDSCARYSGGHDSFSWVQRLPVLLDFSNCVSAFADSSSSFCVSRVETSPTTTELEANPSMATSFLTRTSSWSTRARAHCPWRTPDPAPTDPSSLSAPLKPAGELHSDRLKGSISYPFSGLQN